MNVLEYKLEDLSTEELKDLLSKIEGELETRAEKKVLYTHNCASQSRYHLSKYPHWAKCVTGIDHSMADSRAFKGEFLSVNSENKIPEKSIVVEVCKNNMSGYLIDESGKHLIDSVKTNFPSQLINKIDNLLLANKK